ncbi:DUF302 domain-containing protein [Marinilabilia rubra]|nr:DUF302 domain-containing protein [Marinilabilia rubra]
MKQFRVLATLLFIGIAMVANAQKSPSITIEKQSKFQLDKTVETIRKSAKDAGWSIPTEHDMQASMKKAGKDVKPTKIIVLCNAEHAFKVLDNDQMKHFLALMPCRVSVYEKADGNTYLSMMNLKALSENTDQETKALMANVQNDINDIIKGVIED